MNLRYATVCSGIEAPSVAWHPLGWRPVFFSEIEPFPSAVLRHHWPEVPNLGDMTRFNEWPNHELDLICGGTPCQAFSVAGLRKGLADPRGNLTLTFLGVLERYRPRWVVWENVPGVLSDDTGAFGAFLGGLGQLGYGFAYRVLDAQYYGLAQRRKRVFVVGHSGGLWQRAAAVLFERQSLCWNPPPSRKKGQGTAADIARSLRARSNASHREDSDNHVTACVSHALNAHGGPCRHDYESETFIPVITVALCSNKKAAGSATNQDAESGMLIPTAYRTSGNCGVMEQGDRTAALNCGSDPNQNIVAFHSRQNGMNTLQPNGVKHIYGSTQETHTGSILRVLREEIGQETFTQWGLGILDSLQPSQILRSFLHGKGIRLPAFSKCWMVHCSLSRPQDIAEGAMLSVREAQREGCSPQRREPSEQCARELGAYLSELSQTGAQTQKFMLHLWQASEGIGILREALSAVQEMGQPNGLQRESAHTIAGVRRLTATECEFLQGFPRHYTAIPWKNKPASECPDGPRYKALGNTMAVPVIRWLGSRIEKVEKSDT